MYATNETEVPHRPQTNFKSAVKPTVTDFATLDQLRESPTHIDLLSTKTRYGLAVSVPSTTLAQTNRTSFELGGTSFESQANSFSQR
jgi:hypothetical protein